MSWVVVLGRGELFGETADDLDSSRLVVLIECGAYGVITRIKVEVKLELWIGKVHDDLVAHCTFEALGYDISFCGVMN